VANGQAHGQAIATVVQNRKRRTGTQTGNPLSAGGDRHSDERVRNCDKIAVGSSSI
jgi:hypothetical protein